MSEETVDQQIDWSREELEEAARGTHGDCDVLLCRIVGRLLNLSDSLSARLAAVEQREAEPVRQRYVCECGHGKGDHAAVYEQVCKRPGCRCVGFRTSDHFVDADKKAASPPSAGEDDGITVRECRGHFHVTSDEFDIALPGDPFTTRQAAQAALDADRAHRATVAPSSPPDAGEGPRVERWAVVDRNNALFLDKEGLTSQADAQTCADRYNALGGWKHYQPLRVVRLVELREGEAIIETASARAMNEQDIALRQRVAEADLRTDMGKYGAHVITL